MIKAKYNLIIGDNSIVLNEKVNGFLSKIDARQIVKIETFNGNTAKCCAITYLDLVDVRDIKLDMLVK
jgi:hypothetical protein